MKRAQIQFEEDVYGRLRQEAFTKGDSIASVVREAVANYLMEPQNAKKKKLTLADFPFIGCVEVEIPEGKKRAAFLDHDEAWNEGMEKEIQRWHKRGRDLRR